jgi:hypothetical protein
MFLRLPFNQPAPLSSILKDVRKRLPNANILRPSILFLYGDETQKKIAERINLVGCFTDFHDEGYVQVSQCLVSELLEPSSAPASAYVLVWNATNPGGYDTVIKKLHSRYTTYDIKPTLSIPYMP